MRQTEGMQANVISASKPRGRGRALTNGGLTGPSVALYPEGEAGGGGWHAQHLRRSAAVAWRKGCRRDAVYLFLLLGSTLIELLPAGRRGGAA